MNTYHMIVSINGVDVFEKQCEDRNLFSAECKMRSEFINAYNHTPKLKKHDLLNYKVEIIQL